MRDRRAAEKQQELSDEEQQYTYGDPEYDEEADEEQLKQMQLEMEMNQYSMRQEQEQLQGSSR